MWFGAIPTAAPSGAAYGADTLPTHRPKLMGSQGGEFAAVKIAGTPFVARHHSTAIPWGSSDPTSVVIFGAYEIRCHRQFSPQPVVASGFYSAFRWVWGAVTHSRKTCAADPPNTRHNREMGMPYKFRALYYPVMYVDGLPSGLPAGDRQK